MAPPWKKPVPGPELHHRFRVVLMDARLDVAAWARSRFRTPSHVRQVALGKREGCEDLLEEMIAFVEERERILAKRLAALFAA